jgi:uncharacterized glyoxalase superfamily protein PhnB
MVSEPRTHLTGVEPQLLTTDLERALAAMQAMGFETAFVYGEPPFYAQVRRDGVRLNYRLVDRMPADPDLIRQDSLLAASITVSGITGLFEAFQQAGVAFHQELRAEPWGAKTFIVQDPDGNLLLFAE